MMTGQYIVEGDFDIALALLVEEQRSVRRLEKELRHFNARELWAVAPITHAVFRDILHFELRVERRCLRHARWYFYTVVMALAIRRRSFLYRCTGRLAPRWPTE